MQPTTQEPADPVESSSEHDDDSDSRRTERVATVLGIATGVFGVVITLGLTLLPSSTLTEKSLISVASLALSAAAVYGIGAWRSIRRFTVTAITVTIALACLAGLSVAAQGSATQGSATQGSATQPQTAASPDDAGLPSASAPSGGRSLLDLTATQATSNNLSSGPETVNAKNYRTTLYATTQETGCNIGEANNQVTYQLDHKYDHFSATVGLADSTPAGDEVTFSVLVDGTQEGSDPTLGVGETHPISINITNAFEISLQDSCTSPNINGTVVSVWIDPVVSN